MFLFFAIAAMAITATLLLILFEPNLAYKVDAPTHPLSSDEYLCLLGTLADADVRRDSRATVFSNGQDFYAAQLAAINNAKTSINLEAYIFRNDPTGQRFVAALTARAQSGVKVNLVLDAIGSFTTKDSTFATLRAAGGNVRWYQPLRWYTLKRLNNRTHRELLIVDGITAFIGGAGIADVWSTGEKGEKPWRDTVCQITGDLVLQLQAAFTENWLEAAEEILTSDIYFPNCLANSTDDPTPSPPPPTPGLGAGRASDHREDPDSPRPTHQVPPQSPEDREGFVVISSPSAGRSTRARVLFQTLLASATQTIHINSPYFLPDRSVQRELIKAVQRGVHVTIITPGPHADHLMTRSASRKRYGTLLKGGVQIHEYQPAMIHAKVLTIDHTFAVLGSTNFDNRSFGLNDEVNLAARSPSLLTRLDQDFQADLAQSTRITYEQWQRRPLPEKLLELAGTLLERNQ